MFATCRSCTHNINAYTGEECSACCSISFFETWVFPHVTMVNMCLAPLISTTERNHCSALQEPIKQDLTIVEDVFLGKCGNRFGV